MVPNVFAMPPLPDMKLAQGPIPLYHQIEQDLRARIMAEEFAPGDVLPTEHSFCKSYGVSRITVRRALDTLLAQGLIVRKRGVGSFVAERREGLRSIQLTGSLDEFLSTAGTLHSDMLSFETCLASEEVQRALGLDGPENVTRLELMATLKGEPVAHLEIYFPQSVGACLREEELRDTSVPIVRTVERRLGAKVMRAEQVIESDRAGEIAARHLSLDASDPVLRVTRVYFLASEQQVEAVFVRYHPKRYRYTIDFIATVAAG